MSCIVAFFWCMHLKLNMRLYSNIGHPEVWFKQYLLDQPNMCTMRVLSLASHQKFTVIGPIYNIGAPAISITSLFDYWCIRQKVL